MERKKACKNKRNKRMYQKGFTLVELILVAALLMLVLSGIFSLFFFSFNSWNVSNSEARILQEASNTVTWMDREIRQAKNPTPTRRAVELVNDNWLDIYTYVNDDLRKVSYRIYNGSLEKSINDIDEAPFHWQTIVEIVEPLVDASNNPHTYFQIDNKTVSVRFRIIGNRKNESIEINNSYSVRSKGVL